MKIIPIHLHGANTNFQANFLPMMQHYNFDKFAYADQNLPTYLFHIIHHPSNHQPFYYIVCSLSLSTLISFQSISQGRRT